MILPTEEANHYRYQAEGPARRVEEVLREEGFSSRLISSIKRKGRLLLNGVPVRFVDEAKPGDVIDVHLPKERLDLRPAYGELDIIHEDDEVLVVNKPALMVTHPTVDYQEETLANYVAGHFKRTGQRNVKVRFVNRLDRDTTGVIVIAKNKFVHHYIQSRMGTDEIVKTYAAIAEGTPQPDSGVIDLPIYRPEEDSIERVVDKRGQPSITYYNVLEKFSDASLIECVLGTGRTHQIRVHLKALGHPLVGDPLYNPESQERFGFDRQALHAARLELPLPKTGRHVFEAKLPEDMSILTNKLRSGKV